jgi:peptidoglycan lytic transglycosylase G
VKKILIALLIVFVMTLAAAAGFAVYALNRMEQPYKGYSESERFVDIPPGSGGAEIRRRLVDAGVVSDEWAFRAALLWTGQARGLKAGEFRFDRPMSVVEVIDKIVRGDVYTHPITFPEGLTIREMAAIYQESGFGTAAEFVKAAQDYSLINDLDPAARDLEGYLFPETYTLPRGTPVAKLVGMMVDRFRNTYAELEGKRSGERDLSIRQLVTLASLVEKETGKGDERPLVSAVYRNRLMRNMLMQADPTVVYALVKAGTYDGNIRRRDLEIDSPYNTYKYPGLPPGPIASPGRAAIEAALAPADVPYLYFVSRNDGSHAFAETLTQHNANVQEHQVQYFRKQRLERQRQRPNSTQ